MEIMHLSNGKNLCASLSHASASWSPTKPSLIAHPENHCAYWTFLWALLQSCDHELAVSWPGTPMTTTYKMMDMNPCEAGDGNHFGEIFLYYISVYWN